MHLTLQLEVNLKTTTRTLLFSRIDPMYKWQTQLVLFCIHVDMPS